MTAQCPALIPIGLKLLGKVRSATAQSGVEAQVKRVVATREGAKVYYVSVIGGTVVEKVFEPEIIS